MKQFLINQLKSIFSTSTDIPIFTDRVKVGVAIITASTVQTQAGGTRIKHNINIITTGNANDAVTLHNKNDVGVIYYLVNLSGVVLDIYPPVGGTINGAAANAKKTLAASAWCQIASIGANGVYRVISGGLMAQIS